MEGFAEANVLGNLTRDPELRYTPSGTACASFSVAVNINRKSGGEKKTEVSYIDIKAWKNTAEYISNYAQKGTQVFVSGQLKQETWEKDGQRRSKIKVIARQVRILSKGKFPGNDRSEPGYDASDEPQF